MTSVIGANESATNTDLKIMTSPQSDYRWKVGVAICFAVAAYVGFRLPSNWSTTLYNVSLFDGTVRRSLFGTVMRPIWALADYDYWAYAAVAFTVLAIAISVIYGGLVRATSDAQRVLITLWLIAPTGPYLFHEVAHLDQIVYLLLFLSLWLWRRTSPYVAVIPVCVGIFVHEMTLLTTLPILVWYVVFESGGRRRHLRSLLVPTALAVMAFLIPPLPEHKVQAIADSMESRVGFRVRRDAVEVYARRFTDRSYYHLWGRSLSGEVARVLPFALAVALFWILVAASAGRPRKSRSLPYLAAGIASVSPFALVMGGFDSERWIFLGLSNFAIIAYLILGQRQLHLNLRLLVAWFVPFALLFNTPLGYFDLYAPRPISVAGVENSLRHGDFFDPPRDCFDGGAWVRC